MQIVTEAAKHPLEASQEYTQHSYGPDRTQQDPRPLAKMLGYKTEGRWGGGRERYLDERATEEKKEIYVERRRGSYV